MVSPPLLYLLFSLFAHRSLFFVSIAAMTAKNSNTNFNTKAKGKPVCICSICEDPRAEQEVLLGKRQLNVRTHHVGGCIGYVQGFLNLLFMH